MRLAYVCADTGIPFLGGKGASVHMREAARALRARGHDVTVVCATLGEGNPAPDVGIASIDALDDVLADADAVLERYALSSGAARSASAARGIPLVLEVNAPIVLEAARYRGLTDVAGALAREREIFATADAAAVVSSALQVYVTARAPGLEVRRVPNGVDVARFTAAAPSSLGLAAGTVAVGYVGGMRPWHGVADLVDAFAAVSGASLVIAGAGQEEAAVRERVERSRLGDRVVFLGALRHDEVPGVLAALDAGVAPYRPSHEFYFSSLKVLEYMAAGLPVVHPSIGDLPSTVGTAGIAYEAGDNGALSKALQRVVDDRDLRLRLGAEGRRRAGSLSWDAVAVEIESLIETCRAKVAAR